MPDRHTPRSDNPLKNEKQTKEATTRLADRARPAGRSTPTEDTVTGQGGSTKGRGEPTNRHPAQRGGVRATDPDADPRAEHGKSPGVKTGPSPADEPSSDRTGTAPDRSGGPSRTGKTNNSRRT